MMNKYEILGVVGEGEDTSMRNFSFHIIFSGRLGESKLNIDREKIQDAEKLS